MANLVRLSANQLLRSGIFKSLSKNPRLIKVTVPIPQTVTIPSLRFINTSSKPPQAQANTSSPIIQNSNEVTETKHWVSWGFDDEQEWLDRMMVHLTFFFGITLCIVVAGAVYCYLPDSKCHDWAQREAYLTLRYREDHGLSPIQVDLIDPSKFTLPTDEELGETEIII